VARLLDRLSDRALRNLKPRHTPYPDGGQLYFRASAGKDEGQINIYGEFRFATTKAERAANSGLGPERWMGLGNAGTRIGKAWHPGTSLREFRQMRDECQRQRRQGIDPIIAREQQRAAQVVAAAGSMTFDECRDGYKVDHEKTWSAAHGRDWLNMMKNHVTPVFGTTPVVTVDTPLVLKVVKPLWTTKHPTARRLRGFVESVLDWASAHHYRTGPNPARWKGCLREALPKSDDVHIVTHHRALPHQDIGKLVADLLPRNDLDALCMLLIIFTAVRLGAAVGARAEEFNLTERIWVIPPSRAKRRGKRKAMPFRVPLSDAAVTIVKRTGVKEGVLFPGVDHKSLAKIGGAETSTHGLRATFKTWAEEQTSHANEIIEMALGHAVGDETEEAYRRGDALQKRAKLMADWSCYCTTAPLDRSDKILRLQKSA